MKQTSGSMGGSPLHASAAHESGRHCEAALADARGRGGGGGGGDDAAEDSGAASASAAAGATTNGTPVRRRSQDQFMKASRQPCALVLPGYEVAEAPPPGKRRR